MWLHWVRFTVTVKEVCVQHLYDISMQMVSRKHIFQDFLKFLRQMLQNWENLNFDLIILYFIDTGSGGDHRQDTL